MRRKYISYVLLGCGLVWCALFAFGVHGQAHAFLADGKLLLDDYFAIQSVDMSSPYLLVSSVQPGLTGYPPVALFLVKLFPNTTFGGCLFSGVSSLIFIGALLVFAMSRKCPLKIVLPLCFASPFLFQLERGNLITITAAAVVLFLAWYDSKVGWQRVVAALALGFATALKISPVVFGFLYLESFKLKEWPWKCIIIAALSTLAFLFVPFVFLNDPLNNIVNWFSNAGSNTDIYLIRSSFGFIPVDRLFRGVLHLEVNQPWPWVPYERMATVALGLIAFGVSFVAKEKWMRWCLLVGALLLVPGNQHFYCLLYIFPALILYANGDAKWPTAIEVLVMVAWVLMLLPVQIAFGSGTLNRPMSNIVLVFGLVALIVYSLGERVLKDKEIGK